MEATSRQQADEISLYIHFPFCLSKCAYCDFVSAPLESLGGLTAARRYLEALNVELDLRATSPEFHGATLVSIYLGGGTPTVLPAAWLTQLIERTHCRFHISDDAEITVEANPGTVDRATVAALLTNGINRVSLGVQSFSANVLNVLGRCHSPTEAQAAIDVVRQAGCRNLNIDLIYGVPGQSLEDWEDTVRRASLADPQHISAYMLSLEESTPLAKAIQAGALAPPDENLAADMYAAVIDALTGEGYVHYEISNFARPGFECRHNRRYWANNEYLGVGVAAHSYRRGMRWNNTADIEVYVDWIGRGVLPVVQAECLSSQGRVGEMLILGLRRAEGVEEAEIAERCGVGPTEVFTREMEELCDQGMIVRKAGRLQLPRDRWLVSNEILSHLVS